MTTRQLCDIFASLAGGRPFSKIDLRQAYHQLELDDNSMSYLTINTHKGLYPYIRLVFGIAASPSIWQRTMDQVLKGIPSTSCILDVMIITGKTDEEHLKNLQSVLRLQFACEQREMQFLPERNYILQSQNRL